MPSLLNPYRDFFHCAGQEFEYEMDVANEVVDSSIASIMPSTPNRYTSATQATRGTPSRRADTMQDDAHSMVGFPPSASPSLGQSSAPRSTTRHVRKVSRS
ncbi:unnamed protein product [Cylindrotheca closterium]|uniref:Uncharacterized protein n=1 Tax=Cylindrotheca closterium TaxID=2856 RepID=A0AAD2FS11_9STRA|nr:unnamed protein product [Cylindrotheca closterium]